MSFRAASAASVPAASAPAPPTPAASRASAASALAAAAVALLAALVAAPLVTLPATAVAQEEGAGVDPPVDRAELTRRLDRLVTDPALSRAHVGLYVQVAETGEVLFDRSGEKRFTAASTAKLLTGAVALRRLGPGFRWRTRVVARGPIESGVLRGSLHVIGDGDPTLAMDDLGRWARALREAGIRRIQGDVVADDRAFPPPIWGRGWMWDELHLGWAAGVTGLQLADASITAWLRPGSAVGEPATITPPSSALPVDVDVETGPPGSELLLDYLPGATPGGGRITGWIPLGRDRARLSFAPRHPTEHLLSHFSRVLDEAGVEVGGRLVRREGEGPPTDGSWSATFRSDSLGAVLPVILRTSDNQGAEALLRTLGRVAGDGGSAREGLEVLEGTLSGWGVEPGAVRLADGSGLSRYDEVAPAALVRVLRTMWQSPHHGLFRHSLPAPGEWGTLRYRLDGTPASDVLRAKTGSLSSVRGLAGYVEDGDGETLIFALLIQGYDAPGGTATALRDLLVEQLSLFHRRVTPGWPDYRDEG